MDTQHNKYDPFIDIDNNGTIVVSYINESPEDDVMKFTNVSGAFNGKGLAEIDPNRIIRVDFGFVVGKLSANELDVFAEIIDRLYSNEIDALAIARLPDMSYAILGETAITDDMDALQWSRADLDKLVAHVRDLYAVPSMLH